MKSIFLIVLLALCHTSLGKPQDWLALQERNFQQGGKDVLVVSGSVDDNAAAEEEPSEEPAEEEIDDAITAKHDKINCDCKKNKPRITYGPEQIVKGKPETYIHHQPKIVVRQPPTHVRIEHPPTIIQPSTIVFRRHGKTIRKPVIYQHLPQDVQVRPVYIKLVKPIEKKVIVENKPSKSVEYGHSLKSVYGDSSVKSVYGDSSVKSVEYGDSSLKNVEYGDLSSTSIGYAVDSRKKSCSCEDDDSKLEYETSYDGLPYHESFDEQVGGRTYSESYRESEHERESLRAHLNVKEVETVDD